MAAHLCDRVNELARERVCVSPWIGIFPRPVAANGRNIKKWKKIRHAAGQAANIAAGDVGDEKRYCTA